MKSDKVNFILIFCLHDIMNFALHTIMEIQQPADLFIEETEAYSTVDFESLFQDFSEILYSYAFYYLNDSEAANSVVNDTFVKLWKGKIRPLHLKPYLYKSVKNACLNYLSQNKNQVVLKDYAELETLSNRLVNADSTDETNEKLLFLERVIANLPTKRQLVFKMFRFEELSYAQIAELLNISVRTVEDHLAKSMQYIHAQAKHLIDQNLTNA